MTSEKFPVTQQTLLRKIGVGSSQLKAVRTQKFLQGIDWTIDKKVVRWTAQAALRAAEILTGVTQPEKENAAPVNVEPSHELVTVTRWRIPNRFLIECAFANGVRFYLRVNNNTNFREGMTVHAHLDSDGWTLVGRCPRFPGRW